MTESIVLGSPARRTERWAGAAIGDTGELTNPVILTQPIPEDDAVQVRDPEALAVAESVLIAGYPMPGCARGSVLRPGLLGGATRVWLGYVDGEPASVAAAHQAAGATLVEYVAVERWSGWLRPAGTS